MMFSIEKYVSQFIRNRIFLPDKLVTTKGKYGDSIFERIVVTTNDGIELSGLRSAVSTDSRYTLVYFHGNGGCAANRAHLVAPLYAGGADIIVADYRGYGGNAGQPNEAGLLLDAQAFIEFALNTTKKPIIVFGHSLGGAVTIQSVSGNSDGIAGLITLGTFSSLSERAPFYIRPFLPDKFAAIQYAGNVKIPWHIMHETNDEVTPLVHGYTLYTKAKNSNLCKFVVHNGGDHQLDSSKLETQIEEILNCL